MAPFPGATRTNLNVRETPSGTILNSPLTMRKAKKRRISADVEKRAAACKAFAENPSEYRSLTLFVAANEGGDMSGWMPKKSQMSRDMLTIFGADWASRRGSGGRGRAGGVAGATTAPGLVTPANASYLLEPCNTPTVLSAQMERNIVKSLEIFENRFGTGVVTSVLIQSIAIEEVLSQLPDIHAGRNVIALWNSGASQNCINVVIRQLTSITKPSWMRSFLARHKSTIRKSKVGRALERHKAAKYQIELVLAHLRNVYQAETFAQIQRFIARTGQMVPGFVRFEGIVQREEQSETGLPDSLPDVRDGQLYVTVLNEPLEHVDAGKRFALDETPIVPAASIEH